MARVLRRMRTTHSSKTSGRIMQNASRWEVQYHIFSQGRFNCLPRFWASYRCRTLLTLLFFFLIVRTIPIPVIFLYPARFRWFSFLYYTSLNYVHRFFVCSHALRILSLKPASGQSMHSRFTNYWGVPVASAQRSKRGLFQEVF